MENNFIIISLITLCGLIVYMVNDAIYYNITLYDLYNFILNR